MSHQEADQRLLERFRAICHGRWDGTCVTWLDPERPPEEDVIQSQFEWFPQLPILRHRYESSIQGKARTGEETVAFNFVSHRVEMLWFDSFHMNYGIMFSEGSPEADGFLVSGEYAVSDEHPPWGWKTRYDCSTDQELTITAWNVSPEGQEDLAIQTTLKKVA